MTISKARALECAGILLNWDENYSEHTEQAYADLETYINATPPAQDAGEKVIALERLCTALTKKLSENAPPDITAVREALEAKRKPTPLMENYRDAYQSELDMDRANVKGWNAALDAVIAILNRMDGGENG